MSLLSQTQLVPPCGGRLVDLLVPAEEAPELTAHAARLPSVQLSERSVCDLELLAVGGFSPLDRLHGEAPTTSASLGEMRLADGTLFPVPVTLPVDAGPTASLEGEHRPARRRRTTCWRILNVEEIYAWDRRCEAQAVAGTLDLRHPLVAEMRAWPRRYASGRLAGARAAAPLRLRRAAADAGRAAPALRAAGCTPNVVAFQTRNPLAPRPRGADQARGASRSTAALLIHPVVGMTKPGDVDHYTRVR